MTLFATNAAFTSGTATNRWDPSMTVSLSGMRTVGNNRTILADSGDHTLIGDSNANTRDAMIYDLRFNGAGNLSGTTQRPCR